MRATARLLVLLALATAAAAKSDTEIIFSKSAALRLSAQVAKLATNRDALASLKDTDRTAWQMNGNVRLSEWIEEFAHIPATLMVDIVLVGFHGDTPAAVQLQGTELEQHLHALKGDLPSVVLDPEPRGMSVRPRLKFRVQHASPQLTQTVNQALQDAAADQKSRPGHVDHSELVIPHWAVDAPVQKDWQRRWAEQHKSSRRSRRAEPQEGEEETDEEAVAAAAEAAATDTDNPRAPAGFTIYVMALGLHHAGAPQIWLDHGSDYAYGYDDRVPGQDIRKVPVPADHANCPGIYWVAPGNQTYMWIDIAAGPVAYGPSAGSVGQVYTNSVPHPRLYKPGTAHQALVPDLAALLFSSALHLVWPPMAHAQLDPVAHSEVEVLVVHMHDSLERPPSRFHQPTVQAALKEAVGGSQTVTVKEAWVSFARCDLCVAAFSEALRVVDAREKHSLLLRARSTKVLDRRALEAALKVYGDSILAYAGLHTADHLNQASRRQLPVFLFDISGSHHTADVLGAGHTSTRDVSDSPQPLLIDGTHKAVALGGSMVVAVASRKATLGQRSHDGEHEPTEMTTSFTCGYHRVHVDASDVTREVLGELLTAGWAVSPTDAFFSPATGQGHNYLWALGNTPYGPLSQRRSLSSPVAHAARRGLALASINSSATRILKVLHGLERVLGMEEGKLEPAVLGTHRGALLERLNSALFKGREAARLMGEWNTDLAVRFARSMSHDAKAIERVASKLSSRIRSNLQCRGAVSLASLWWAPAGSLALWPLAILVRRKVYAPKVEKIY